MSPQYNQLLEVSNENIAVAMQEINAMAKRRNLLFVVGLQPAIPQFPSQAAMKKFRRRMNRAIATPTMRTANVFLRALGHSTVEYSKKELAIRAARAKYVQARNEARKAHEEYLAQKGDFYGGRVKVGVDVLHKAA